MSRVYPRVCGGTPASVQSVSSSVGLSPRVRGNRHERAVGGGSERSIPASIPACAGEPLDTTLRATLVLGLSPRVRGNHGLWQAATVSDSRAVYPRVCGGTASRFVP